MKYSAAPAFTNVILLGLGKAATASSLVVPKRTALPTPTFNQHGALPRGTLEPSVHWGYEIKEVASAASISFKDALAQTPSELSINAVQLSVLLALFWVVRIQPGADWTARLLQHFPYNAMHDYERLSAANWIAHYLTLVCSVGIMQHLFARDSNHGGSQKKRRAYAIAVTIPGNLFGSMFLLSHSLVGTRSPSGMAAMQALHNSASSFMALSTMSVGMALLLPTMWALLSSLVVGGFILKGVISFGNLPGILLANLGLVAVLFSKNGEFPSLFKLGHCLLSFTPLVVSLVDKQIGAGSDLGHMIAAVWILASLVVQHLSL